MGAHKAPGAQPPTEHPGHLLELARKRIAILVVGKDGHTARSAGGDVEDAVLGKR